MKSFADRRRAFLIAVEFLLAIAMIAGFVRLTDVFIVNGYLPAPFVYDVSDTFMDWFNTAYWAHNPGAYEVWHSIYAPLSFVILKIFGEPACYVNGPREARDCDMVGIVAILASYASCVIAATIAFYKRDRSTAPFRAIGFGLSLPLLYALERGNLIMIALFAYILLFGEMIKSTRAISLASALLINMKTYLLFPVLALAVKRDWRTLEICGFATLGLYLITVMIMGSGTPFDLAANLKIWFGAMEGVVWDQVLYSTTYAPYLLFDERGYPIRDYIPQQAVDIAKLVIEIELVASRALAFICILGSWLYPRAISMQRVALFLIMQSFIVQNPGGYAVTLIIFLVFLERWDGIWTGLAIIFAYIISIPTDYLVGTFYSYGRNSWLSGRVVDSAYGISIGALFRPALFAFILWVLAIDSLVRFYRASKAGPPMFGMSDTQTPPAKPSAP